MGHSISSRSSTSLHYFKKPPMRRFRHRRAARQRHSMLSGRDDATTHAISGEKYSSPKIESFQLITLVINWGKNIWEFNMFSSKREPHGAEFLIHHALCVEMHSRELLRQHFSVAWEMSILLSAKFRAASINMLRLNIFRQLLGWRQECILI